MANSTQGIKRPPSPEDEPERGKSKGKGKGKGKKKGHDKLKKDRPASPDSADTPDEPADEIPVEPLPDVIDPETLEPVPGDINLSDDAAFMPVVVNAASEVIPALFEQWYAEKYGTHGTEDGYPDPALHPQLVREYLDDTQN